MPSSVVITFHGVGPISRPLDPGERDCWLDLKFFRRVLDLIKTKGEVIITVDDGNLSDLEYVLPELSIRNLKAVFFPCSGRLSESSFFLSAQQLRELSANGMTIGSHGKYHRPWRGLTDALAREEFENSRVELAHACGNEVTAAACPFGVYERKTLRRLREARFTAVYTSDGGTYLGGWLIPRTTIRRSMEWSEVERVLSGIYDLRESCLFWIKRTLKRYR